MPVIELGAIIGVIAKGAVPIIKSKAERNEFIIKTLKRFNLDPTHPPADFDAVYAYTLVEYGIDKPKPVLEMFRHPDIWQAFHTAFDQSDISILIGEGERLLDWNKIGDQIRELEIDPQHEFLFFNAAFNQVVDRTRMPSEEPCAAENRSAA